MEQVLLVSSQVRGCGLFLAVAVVSTVVAGTEGVLLSIEPERSCFADLPVSGSLKWFSPDVGLCLRFGAICFLAVRSL